MPTGQQLGDLLAGFGGAPVDRAKLDSFVATSQARNGLVSAQTQEAQLNAMRAQEEMDASDQLENALVEGGAKRSDAHIMGLAAKMHAGSAVNAMDMFKSFLQAKEANPELMNTPEATAAYSATSGKQPGPQVLPPNYFLPPGAAAPTGLQSVQGAAQTNLTGKISGLDVAKAEEEHAKAKNLLSPSGGLSPGALDAAAKVVMADPTKMSAYAGYGAAGAATKNAINNRIAEMLNESGMTPDNMIQQRAVAKASVGAAGTAAKQQQILDAYGPLVKSNSDRIMTLLDQMHADGSDGIDEPFINSWERHLGRALNSDDLNELHSVFTSYQFEIARMLTAGPSMNGVISDHSRAEVQGMAPESMSASNARRVLGRVETEIGIRRQGVHNSLEEAANAQLPVTSQPHNLPPPAGAAPQDTGLPSGFTRLN